jgi:chromosome partitioning protein
MITSLTMAAMVILAIVNQKGGAGKTPTAVHLAFALAKAGNRVLFIDADSQASASLHFLGLKYKSQTPTFYNAITTLKRIDPIAIMPTLHLLSSHDELERAEVEIPRPGTFYQAQLKKLLGLYQGYDYVVIDTPGSRISIFTVLALTAANLVIVPVKTEFAAQQATVDTMSLIEDVRTGGLNPGLTVWGILPNQFESTVSHHREVLDMLQDDYKGQVYAEPSRKTTKYNDAMGARTDIRQLDPALGEYWDRVAQSIVQKGKGL